MRRLAPILLFLAVLVLAGCGTKTVRPTVSQATVDSEAELQRERALTKELEHLVRLMPTSYKVASSNVAFCRSHDKTFKSMGIFLTHPGTRPDGDEWAAAYQKVMHASPDAIAIIAVAPGGAADRAGLRRGDALLSVNGEPLKVNTTRNLNKSGIRPHELAQKGDVVLRVRRDGQEFEATLQPDEVCASFFILVQANLVNAMADGRAVYVFQGMMDYARTDDELALILGHELAHNVMGHPDSKKAGQVLGMLLDLALGLGTGVNTGLGAGMGGLAYSQEYEAEADYVGMYFAANAGADLKTAPEIWRRMAADSPGAMSGGATHPGSAERFTALEATRAEIERKKAAGQALVPEMKTP